MSVMTPEDAERFAKLEASDAKRKAYKKKWYEEWKKTATPEEIAEVRSKERERKRAERAQLTPEQRDEIRKADRQRKSKDKMTEEQLEARREYNREWKRKQREAKKAEADKEPISDMATAIKELKKGTAVLK